MARLTFSRLRQCAGDHGVKVGSAPLFRISGRERCRSLPTFHPPASGSARSDAGIPYGGSIWTRQGIRTEKPVYAANEPIVVAFSGFPGNEKDWITVVPVAAPPENEGQYQYTGGKRTGSFTFEGFAPGEYEARAYFDWPQGGHIVQDRYRFKVGDISPTVVLRTQKPIYAPKEPIVVEYFGFPGNGSDWVTVAPASNSPDQYGQYSYTGGKRGGFFPFTGPEKPGAYEARACFNWPAGGYTIQARYSFTVGESGAGGGTGGGICDDPRTQAIMDEWLSRAIPPRSPASRCGTKPGVDSWVGPSRPSSP